MIARPIKTVSVIGAGSWGTALARLLACKGYTIRLWAHELDVVESIRSTRRNEMYLPDFPLPDSLSAMGSLAEVVHGTDLLLLAVPSHAMHAILEQLRPHLADPLPITIATKGIEENSFHLMSNIVESLLPQPWHPFVTILSGPSFAREVCQEKPTTILLAGHTSDLVTQLQHVFLTPQFRVYAGHDMIGAQIGGALKNVMAIASGIVDGLELGFNTRAALITRGLAEMIRLGVAMGADVSTLYGLSGLGDLVLTCTGSLSRNYTVGLKLGQGSTLEEILSHTSTVAEGIRTTRAASGLAQRHHIEMPIVDGVHQVLFEGMDPRQAVANLMNRAAKVETDRALYSSTPQR
ncbi:MAG: glycerol-3-phosphate dehydrogenase [NAD(P)+] [Nitrospirales bacterium]|nr:MAG: glycerol-3-phosphate dehydrogenase [NAD(P)+] [Nitrospirales bacterium]